MRPKKKQVEYRSGLESAFQTLCTKDGIKVGYETDTLRYLTAPAKRVYKPDWTVVPGVYVETKGYWDFQGRQKALYIRDQHPDVKVLYVFQRSHNTISKGSKTTYGDWATKNNLEWCSFNDTEFWMAWIKNHQSKATPSK